MSDEFVESVRCGNIRSPTQRGFDRVRWRRAYAELVSPSEADLRLYEAGLWFTEPLEAVRADIDRNFPWGLSRRRQIRALVGFINQQALVLQQYESEAAEAHRQGRRTHSELLGGPATHAEIMQIHAGALESYVEALRYPLSRAGGLADRAGAERVLRRSTAIRDIVATMNLAAVYNLLEHLWAQCLWRGWYIQFSGDVTVVVQPDTATERVTTAGQHRWHLLRAEMLVQRRHLEVMAPRMRFAWEAGAPAEMYGTAGSGKQRRVGVSDIPPEDARRLRDMYDGFLASDVHLQPLLQRRLGGVAEVTLDTVLRGRLVIAAEAMAATRRLPEDRDINAVGTLEEFAPLRRKVDLRRMIERSLALSPREADAVLQLFVATGAHRDDMWTRPLVPVDHDRVALLLPVAVLPNLARELPLWMRAGGLDLDVRGPIFEKAARSELADLTALPNAQVFPDDCVFRFGDQEEQIDLVVVLGNRVIIGELRALRVPSSPHDLYVTAEQDLAGKAAQARRKADFASRHRAAFLAHIGAKGLNPEAAEFLPLVVTDSAVFSGSVFSGVPVVDMPILCTYFIGGGLPVVGRINTDGTVQKEKSVTLFDDPDDAAKRLPEYLANPPQVNRYRDALIRRIVPPISFGDGTRAFTLDEFLVDFDFVRQDVADAVSKATQWEERAE